MSLNQDCTHSNAKAQKLPKQRNAPTRPRDQVSRELALESNLLAPRDLCKGQGLCLDLRDDDAKGVGVDALVIALGGEDLGRRPERSPDCVVCCA